MIDECASEVVKGIFEMTIKGFSPDRIAAYLNKNGIMAPYEYKRQTSNYTSGFKGAGESLWNHVTIRRMLANTVYIGELAQGKTATPSFKIKKARTLSRDMWSIVENNHEAIIEPEVFQTVQKILSRDIRISSNEQVVQPLAGVVFCGDCGRAMCRRNVKRGNKTFHYYWCGAYKRKQGCTTHNISQEMLEKAVFDSIKNQINVMVELDELANQIDVGAIMSLKLKRIELLITEKENERDKHQDTSMKLYDSYVEELISREEYRSMKEKYVMKIKECEAAIKELEEQRRQVIEDTQGSNSWIYQFIKYKDMDELSHEIVVALIDRIDIYEDKRIQITFNYKNEFLELVNNVNELRKEVS